MKELKHIKIFENFNSSKLNKIFKFIDKESRDTFRYKLEKISSRLDFPMSNFSDDMFEYLPFKSALKKVSEDKVPCEQHNNDGGKCNNCDGSGYKTNDRIKLIKFWFDKDGKYINTTAYDGSYKPSANLYKFSDKIEDYIEDRVVSSSEACNLPSGTIIKFKTDRVSKGYIICMTYKDNNKSTETYLLNNELRGSIPRTLNYGEYSDYSWVIDDYGTGDNINNSVILIPKNKVNNTLKSYYDFNGILSYDLMCIDWRSEVESKLNGAHFALILDYSKLSNSKFNRRSDIKVKREEDKKGVFLTNDEIKNMNIDRYMSKIVDNFDTSKLSSISKILPRALGWSNSIIFLDGGINFSTLETVINLLYEILDGNGDKDKLKRTLYDINKKTLSYNLVINEKLKLTYESFSKYDGQESRDIFSKRYTMFKNYIELGSVLNNKLKKLSTETISDMEISFSKIKSLRIIAIDRLTYLRSLRYISEYLRSKDKGYNVFNEVMDIPEYRIDKIIKDIESFRKIIEDI